MIFIDDDALVSFVTKAQLPDWQTKLFSKYRNEIQVHSKGQLFYKIDRLFPNENPLSKDHRLLSFEPITKSSFNKGITNIMRIFGNSSYTCEASEETMKVITEHNFDDKNLFSYFLDQWVSNALALDPNSLIVTYPPDFIKDKTFDQVIFIKSDNIVYFDSDTFIFRSEEESDVKYEVETIRINNEIFFDTSINSLNLRETVANSYSEIITTKFVRTVYHAFVQDKFYRIEQGIENPNAYTLTTFSMPFATPPVIFAGGMRAENRTYESFLATFVPFGNLALLQHSQHTAVNFIYSFPRMSEIQSPCENELCHNGLVDCEVSEIFPEGKCPCKVCRGTGYTSVQSPYKTYVKRYDPTGLTEDNKALLEADDVKFYTPDVGILNYSKEEWKDYLEMAEMAIYVQQKVQTGNVESAKSKEVDLTELYAFLMRIAKTFYDRLRFVIQQFENYTVSNPAQVTVNIPFSFAILSEQEAFDALNTILSSNAPSIIKGNQVETFILKFVSQSSPIAKAYNVLKLVDVLLLKNDNEISTLKANNIVTAEQWSIHTFSYPVLMQMYEGNRDLFDQEAERIAEQLNLQLQQYKPPASALASALQNRFAAA